MIVLNELFAELPKQIVTRGQTASSDTLGKTAVNRRVGPKSVAIWGGTPVLCGNASCNVHIYGAHPNFNYQLQACYVKVNKTNK